MGAVFRESALIDRAWKVQRVVALNILAKTDEKHIASLEVRATMNALSSLLKSA